MNRFDFEPATESIAELPDWVRVVRMRRGRVRGLYALWDTRKTNPFVPFPPGLRAIHPTSADVVVDIGAYIGAFSWVCAHAGATVRAYEPSNWPAACLQMSIDNGGPLAKRITLHRNVVLGPPDGHPDALPETCTFFVARGGLGLSNSAFNPPRDAMTVTAPVVSYADVIRHDATIIKMDAEGAEYGYWPLIHDRVRAVIISFHHVAGLAWRAMGRYMIDSLLAAGFYEVKPITAWKSGSYNAEGVWLR